MLYSAVQVVLALGLLLQLKLRLLTAQTQQQEGQHAPHSGEHIMVLCAWYAGTVLAYACTLLAALQRLVD
jgi:hypothetical protein